MIAIAGIRPPVIGGQPSVMTGPRLPNPPGQQPGMFVSGGVPDAGGSNSMQIPPQPISSVPSSAGNNEMLRKQLEQVPIDHMGGMGIRHPNLRSPQLSGQPGGAGAGLPPTSSMSAGPGMPSSSLLLSQLERQPSSDPNPNVINQVSKQTLPLSQLF